MLLLLPPIGLDRHCWDWLDLPDGATARYEPPGIGRRAGEPAGVSLAALADELAARFPGPLDVVGISFGGMVAQHLALRHPGKVRSLLLAATTAEVDDAVLEQRARSTEDVGMEGVLEDTLRRWFSEEALAATEEDRAIAYARQTLRSCDPGTFAAAWRAMKGQHVGADLSAIRAPTTCLAGTRDASTPRSSLEAIAVALRAARLLDLDGPHMVHLETPAAFSEALADHLAWAARLGSGGPP